MQNTGKLSGRTAFITGASRGIGLEIALKLARDGANIVVVAKTVTPHPKLPGTIHSAARAIEAAGGQCLACAVDIRDEAAVQHAVDAAVQRFGGIDILINNASAIALTGTLDTTMKSYDLMNNINARGTFLWFVLLYQHGITSQKCIPHLKKSKNAHILNISPPLLMETQWFHNHVAYTMAKFGMSMCVLGMHEELRSHGIAVNALWPRTAIWTSALEMLAGESGSAGSRKATIMADAAYAILTRDSRSFTGNFCIDDSVLKDAGITDFDQYAITPGVPLMLDFFVPGVEHETLQNQWNQYEQHQKSTMSTGPVMQTMKQLESMLSSKIVSEIGAIYQFKLTGDESGEVYVDLKNGAGSIGQGSAPNKADVTMTLSADDFVRLFQGKLNATKAFLSGQLKMEGDKSKAINLQSLLKQVASKKKSSGSSKL